MCRDMDFEELVRVLEEAGTSEVSGRLPGRGLLPLGSEDCGLVASLPPEGPLCCLVLQLIGEAHLPNGREPLLGS